MEIAYPVAIFHDTEHYQEHQVVLREAGATRAYKGPLRHNERRIGRNFHIINSSKIKAYLEAHESIIFDTHI